MNVNQLLLISALAALSGCGGNEDAAPSGNSGVSGGEVVEPTTTRFVDELPTYESRPLPEGLVWETNLEDAPFASPEAQRGGEFRTSMLSFPLTLRTVGPDSNGAFANYLRQNQVSLVGQHPNTLKFIPALATEWAFDDDGKTVYYRLDPNARWSDGMPVTADDFVFTATVFMRSEHIVDPWYNNHYTKNIVDVVKHDDHTISVVGATPKPREEILNEYGFAPYARHFHKLDERWVEDYNWRIPPGTGPYQISRIEKGQFVEFRRNPNWWGDGNQYFANRYNPDTIRVTVIRDTNVAWEYFLRGEVDAFPVILPNFWYEKAQGELFDKGYIEKIKYYTDSPQPSQGMWLNMDDPVLADHDVRLGLAYSMNVDMMLTSLLRGDYERLRQHYDGYWDYTNPNIQARPFDLAKADEHFNAAGWSRRGPDGIRMKENQRLAFSVVYSTQDHTPRLVLLREEARKAGVELNLQLQDSSAAFKQILEKKHQIAWMGWSTSATPQFWEHYHSENAHKPQTNNITNTDDPALDALIIQYQEAIEKPTRVQLAHQIQQQLYEMGQFIPMYKVPYTREAYWRWLKLPPTRGTRISEALFSPMGEQLLSDGLFWIDQAAKVETQEARASGRAFAPVLIVDETWHVQ